MHGPFNSARTISVFLLLLTAAVARPDTPPPTTIISCDEVLRGLEEKSDAELRAFIRFLSVEVDNSRFSASEIAQIIGKLAELEQNDSYQTPQWAKGVPFPVSTAYANRESARVCICRFRFQKYVNRVRQTPMEKRVEELIRTMTNPPDVVCGRFWWVQRELVETGPDAVPFIIRRRPEADDCSRRILPVLADIGDPRGSEWIVRVLRQEGHTWHNHRREAAQALGNFRGEKVTTALIDALKDETFWNVDARMPQSTPPGHKPWIGRHYTVQHEASKSLTRITGHDWGYLYNEDYQTWRAWLGSAARDEFSPAYVKRTRAELASLIEALFHRYMSGRPDPHPHENEMSKAAGLASIARDLQRLGDEIVPVLMSECEARIAATPIWRDDLREWTQRILIGMGTPGAMETAQKLGRATQDTP